MRAAGVSGLAPRKRRRTTVRLPGVRVAADLVERDFRPTAPNQTWSADITYISTWEGFLYLAHVQDLHSRRIVGWSMADHLRSELVVDALKMALARRRPDRGLIHHSDQGCQGGFKGSSQRSIQRSCDGQVRRRASDRAGRPAMGSPGRPPAGRREHRQRFWAAIARGATSLEAAAGEAGVSGVVGVRWFREGGGILTSAIGQAPLSGRYLSFAEREGIALLRAPGSGRARSRVSSGGHRRLSRVSCAATRPRVAVVWTIGLSTAQWHADLRARRPKPAKLAVNAPLRRYVQDRLSGLVKRPGGSVVAGPEGPVDRSSSRPAQGPSLGQGVES